MYGPSNEVIYDYYETEYVFRCLFFVLVMDFVVFNRENRFYWFPGHYDGHTHALDC